MIMILFNDIAQAHRPKGLLSKLKVSTIS